jgi:hypothetical protein
MRIAETTRSCSLVALGTLATVSLIAVTWATAPSPAPEMRSPLRPMRGCAEHVKAAPLPAPKHNSFADTLIDAREALTACMKNTPVDVRLSVEISEAGRATSVEVKALTDDVSQLDLHVVKCLDGVVSGLSFPRGPNAVRVSTHLTQR